MSVLGYQSQLDRLEGTINNVLKDVKELKSELKNDVKELKNDVEELKSELKNDVKELKNDVEELKSDVKELNYHKAKESIRKFNASILHNDCPIGHGMVIQKNTSHYLCTAVHVLNVLTYPGNICKIHEHEFELLELFIPEDYVLHGYHDIGLAKIQFLETFQINTQKIKIGSPSQVGNQVMGVGTMHISGHVVHEGMHKRLLVNSLSSPGCSGAPVFSSKGDIVAMLHGCNKHRHTTAQNTDICTANMSGYVFVDAFPEELVLRFVQSEHYKLLQYSENFNLSDKFVSKPGELFSSLEISKIPDSLKDLVENLWENCKAPVVTQLSLNLIMKKLRDRIWDGSGKTETLSHGEVLCCVWKNNNDV